MCSIFFVEIVGQNRKSNPISENFYQERMMHAVIFIEKTLYIDPQAARPAAYCDDCGGALYLPSLMCLRCERRRQ